MKLSGKDILILGALLVGIKACGGNDDSTKQVNSARVIQTSQEPFIPSPEPASAATSTLYVGPSALNVRDSPDGKITSKVTHGTPVTVYVEQDGWGRISDSTQAAKWVAISYLCKTPDCTDIPKWKTPIASQQPTTPKPRPSSRAYSCPCSSSSNCYGPRGGRYCITSGGNKRYR